MENNFKRVSFLLLFFTALCLCSVKASVFYVNDNSTVGDIYTTGIGNVGNTGTSALPLLTLPDAITLASNGDTIYVDAGTYTGNVTISKSLNIFGPNISKTGYDPARSDEAKFLNTKFTLSGTTSSVLNGIQVYNTNNVAIDMILVNSSSTSVTVKNTRIERYGTVGGIIARGIVTPVGSTVPIIIQDNFFTGDSTGNVYSAHLTLNNGIFCNGGSNILIKGNKFDIVRTAVNVDNMSAGVTIEDNIFENNGTALAFGGTTATSGSYTISNNSFKVTGTIANLSNVTTAFRLNLINNTFNAKATGDLSKSESFLIENTLYHRGRSSRNGMVTFVPNTQFVVSANPNIQTAVTYIDAGGIIKVDSGTYTQDISINKPLTLIGANTGIPYGGSRLAESKLLPATSGSPAISMSGAGISDSVTIDGFDISGTLSNNAIYCGNDGPNHLKIIYNYIHDVGTARGSGNVYAINYRVNNPSTDDINISNNYFDQIFNGTASALGHSAAIWVGQSTANGVVSNLKIENNTIRNVKTGLSNKEASAIYIGVAWGAGTGSVIAPLISGNKIYDISGGIAYAIQLSGKTPGAIVSNNEIQNINNALFSPIASFGVAVPNTNTGFETINVNNNSITNTLYAIYNGNASAFDATCNWLGSSIASEVASKVSGNLDVEPFLISGNDAQPSMLGFQSEANSCRGASVTVNSVSNNALCFGDNGSIELSITGGVAPFAINWGAGSDNTSDVSYNITNLAAGVYNISITDSLGTVVNISDTISQPALLASSATVTVCDSYVWNVNGNTYTTSGVYLDTITALNGCDSVVTLDLTINISPSAPTVDVSNNCNGTATLTASNYTGALLWSNSATTSSITVNTNGAYSVTQSENSCTSNATLVDVTLNVHSGNIWYVNDNSTTNDVYTTAIGSNSNIGTAGCPFATITYAMSQAKSEDTIYVDAGTYAGTAIVVNKLLSIIGAGENTVVQNSGGNAFTYTTDASGRWFDVRAKLKNLKISGSSKAIYADQIVNFVDFSDLIITGNTTYGIHINNTSGIMTHWDVTNNDFNGNGNGFYISTAGNLFDLKLNDNTFRNSTNNGFYVGQSSSNPGALNAVTISGNTFTSNGTALNNQAGMYIEKLSNATITNNSFTNNGLETNPRGIIVNLKYGSYENVSINNNIFSETRAAAQTNGYAINVQGRNDATSYNTFPGTLSSLYVSGNEMSGFLRGIEVDNAVDWNNTYIVDNIVSNCNYGILGVVYGAGNTSNTSAEMEIHNNAITGFATGNAIVNANPNGGTIDATCNWFGNSASNIVNASITGSVTVDHWLTSGVDAQVLTPGFQPSPGTCNGLDISATSENTNVTCNGATNGSLHVHISGGVAPFSIHWTLDSIITNDSNNDITNLSAGIYNISITDFNGSTVNITDTISEPAAITSAFNVTACNNYEWIAAGKNYSSSGVYTETLVAENGCDSTVTLTLTIKNGTSSSMSATACDSYVWAANGNTYTESGIYEDTLTAFNGCDSIVTLNLTINITPAAPVLNIVNNCNSTATLTASDYTGTLLWSNNATTASITVSSNGTYTVTQTVNACVSTPASANVTLNVHSGKIWYVNDNNTSGDVYTTAVGSNTNIGTAGCPFATVTYAISQATAGDTIKVDAGSYTANTLINKTVILLGANAGISAATEDSRATRNSETIIDGGFSVGSTTFVPNDVIIDGFKFIGSAVTYTDRTRIAVIRGLNTKIKNNIFDSEMAASTGYLVSGNSTFGITIGGSYDHTGLEVNDNYFVRLRSGVFSNPNASTSQIYSNNQFSSRTGINFDHYGSLSYNASVTNNNFAEVIIAGDTVGPVTAINCTSLLGASNMQFTGNTITTNYVGIDFKNIANGAVVNISNNIFKKRPSVSDITYHIWVRIYPGTSGVTIQNNSLTEMGTGYAIHNQGTGTVNATCNWFGTFASATVASKVSGNNTTSPWLIDGTDDQPLTAGFQPVSGACLGSVLTATSLNSNVLCNGGNNGSLLISLNGGIPPYAINWGTGSDITSNASYNITGLSAGTYNISITDSIGTIINLTDTISEPTLFNLLAANVTTLVPCNGGTGEVSIEVEGGVTPYIFVLNNDTINSAATTQLFTGVLAGTNQVVSVADANGCNVSSSVNVSEPSLISASSTVSLCPPSLPYVINDTSISTTGTYVFSFTASNGCDSIFTLNFTVLPVTYSTTNLSICESQYPFTWNGETFTVPGTYVVTIVNGFGCDSIATLNLSTYAGGPGLPTATTGASRCNTGTVVLTATTPLGVTVDWFSAATGGTLVGLGTNTFTTPSIPVTRIYYAQTRNTTTGCSSSTRVPVTATVNVTPVPSNVNGFRCGAGSVEISATSGFAGQLIDWYSSLTGGTLLASNQPTFNTPSISTTTSYFAQARDTFTGCISQARVQVIATISTTPTTPTSTNNFSRCGSGTIVLTATSPSGAPLTWFAAPTGGTALKLFSNSYTTPVISATTTYYVEAQSTNSTCVSPRIPVQAVVNNIPNAPTAVDGNRCGAGEVEISAVPPSGSTIDWYAAATLGSPLLSGSSTFYTPAITSTKNYYATSRDTLTGCVSGTRSTVKATINPLASIISTTPRSRCGSGTVLLTAGTVAGMEINWYSDSLCTNLLATTLNFTTPIINETTKFYAQAKVLLTGCVSAPVPVIATVLSLPVIESITPSSRCGNGSLTLSATAENGSVVDWSVSSTTTSVLFTGNLYTTPSIGLTTKYFLQARNTTTGCKSATKDSVFATVNSIPALPVGISGTSCGIGNATLSATVPSGSLADWFDVSTGGVALLEASNSFVVPVTATTTYYVQSRNTTTGCFSARVPVQANLSSVPDAPIATSVGRCGSGIVTLSASSSGNTINWFADSIGGVAFATNKTSYTTPVLSSTVTYYLESLNTSSGCKSVVRTPIVASVNDIPLTPTAVDGSRCSSGVVDISAIAPIGSTIDWYAAATFGSPLLSNSTTFTSPVLTATKYYYAGSRDILSGCVSSTRTLVKAIVNPYASILSTTPRSRCGSGTVLLSATTVAGSVIDWFSDSLCTNLLGTTFNFTTPVITETTTFYARARVTATGCLSSVMPVIATVNPLPLIETITPASRCGTGTVILSATGESGTVIDWFLNNATLIKAYTGNSFTTPSLITSVKYYMQARNTTTGCSSIRDSVTATINAIPANPVATGASTCGAGNVTLTATLPVGSTADWYDAASGGNLLQAGGTSFTTFLNATTTYYVQSRNETTGCISATRVAVVGTLGVAPTAPTTTSASRCGTGTVILAATAPGFSINWYADSVGGVAIATNKTSYTTPVLTTTTTYYVESRNTTTGCVSTTRTAVTATINAIPTLPIAIDGSRCGTGTINISAIAPLGSTIDWYAASTLGSPLQSSSTSFTTPELTATKYYYAASRDELSGCVSTTRTLVKAVINPLPTLLSPTPRSRCGTGTVMLSAGTYAGSVIDWYSDSTLTNLLATTLNYTTPVISVSTTYYIQARSTTAGCVSAVVPVTATVNSLPQITEVQNGFSCTPGTVLVSATPTAGATIDWYATNVSTVKLATGSNMYLTPSISSTKVYYASARDITTGCVSAVRYAATAEINASLCNSLVDDNDNVSKQTPSASRMNIQDKLLVYPNPTSGRTIIRFTSSKDTDVSLALYNSVGQMVFESIKAAVTGDNQYEIEFSDLSTGFYFLNITDGKELLLTTKVVKQ